MQKLTADQKKLIAVRIVGLDPQHELVTLTPNSTLTGGIIAYNESSGIVLHQNVPKLTDEEYVRAYIVVRLVKQLKYPADALELEKLYTIGRPSPTRAKIDIKVLDKRNPKKPKTFVLIEAKRPEEFASYSKLIEDQIFSTANHEYAAGIRYVAWYSIDFSTSDLRDKCIVINLRKYHEHNLVALAVLYVSTVTTAGGGVPILFFVHATTIGHLARGLSAEPNGVVITLLLTVPHGTLELAGFVVLASSILSFVVKLGLHMVLNRNMESSSEAARARLIRANGLGICLLLSAAFIEAYVTPDLCLWAIDRFRLR